jgi:hypothetical protein
MVCDFVSSWFDNRNLLLVAVKDIMDSIWWFLTPLIVLVGVSLLQKALDATHAGKREELSHFS